VPFINPPQVLPEAARFIIRYLLAVPNQTEEQVVAAIAPSGLAQALANPGSPADPSAPNPGKNIVTSTITALRGAELVSGHGGQSLELASTIRSEFASSDAVTAPAFATWFLREVVSQVADEGDIQGTEGAADLAYAFAFVLRMPAPLVAIEGFDADAGQPNKRSFSEAQARLLGPQERWIIRNKERFAPFVRWAEYLGFARSHGSRVYFDATRAIGIALDTFDPAIYPIEEFVDRLGVVAPFTERGTLGVRMAAAIVDDDPSSIAPGLAFALRGLEVRNRIQIQQLADAKGVAASFGARSSLNATHVTVLEST